MTYLLEYGKLDPDSEWNNPIIIKKEHKMSKTMVNEKILRKDTISGLVQFHGISEKRAKKICNDDYMEKVMDAMFDAQSDFIVNTKIKDKWVKSDTEFVSKDANIE